LRDVTLIPTFRAEQRNPRKKLLFAAYILTVMFLIAGLARAEEKYWIARQASLIVVGTLHPQLTFPWLDGCTTLERSTLMRYCSGLDHLPSSLAASYAHTATVRPGGLPVFPLSTEPKGCGSCGPSMNDHGVHRAALDLWLCQGARIMRITFVATSRSPRTEQYTHFRSPPPPNSFRVFSSTS
jgi:hypothetical protein